MSTIFNRKIEIIFSKDDERILNGQSKICNWFYNQLLQAAIDDYEKGSPLKLQKGYNLRNYGIAMKKDHPFLCSVYSSPLKNAALRLKETYDRFFDGIGGYPNFRSWKKKWFSLFYDEPNKGYNIINSFEVSINLGVNENNKRMSVTGRLIEPFYLGEDDLVKTFRLCKQQGNRFYAIFTIERFEEGGIALREVEKTIRKMKKDFVQTYSIAKPKNKPKRKAKKKATIFPPGTKWISLDPNHKNFFTAIDYRGQIFECSTLFQTKFWDKEIDRIKAKRDVCLKKSKKCTTFHGNTYWKPSKRWTKLNYTLDRAYHKRREQIKVALYNIAHYLYDHYDVVVIGDYTPSIEVANEGNMKRSMLNQSHIGELRSTLEWVATKRKKQYLKIDETNTTKDCCVCGYQEKKGPDIRSFTCVGCGHTFLRDANSAINISKKAKLLSGSDWVTEWKFDTITYAVQSVLHGKPHNLSIVPTASQADKLNPAA